MSSLARSTNTLSQGIPHNKFAIFRIPINLLTVRWETSDKELAFILGRRRNLHGRSLWWHHQVVRIRTGFWRFLCGSAGAGSSSLLRVRVIVTRSRLWTSYSRSSIRSSSGRRRLYRWRRRMISIHRRDWRRDLGGRVVVGQSHDGRGVRVSSTS